LHRALEFLKTNADEPYATILLAHGAGAPMDSPFMNEISTELAANGVDVFRFEFAYMAARRTGSRKPPPRADRLTQEFIGALDKIETGKTLFIGGKSMGGRVASMVAEGLYQSRGIAGLICLGYPFHPPAKPATLRVSDLETLTVPTLICQGTRDPFGTREQVEDYRLSEAIDLLWLEDGDHDFKPRKTSGLTQTHNIRAATKAICEWTLARR